MRRIETAQRQGEVFKYTPRRDMRPDIQQGTRGIAQIVEPFLLRENKRKAELGHLFHIPIPDWAKCLSLRGLYSQSSAHKITCSTEFSLSVANALIASKFVRLLLSGGPRYPVINVVTPLALLKR